MNKRCFKCLAILPLDEFYRHPMMGDGLLDKCKSCTKRDVRENRKAKHAYYIDYDRARANEPHRAEARRMYTQTERGKEVARASNRKWSARNPHKRSAQIALGNAIRDGRVTRQPCEVCGEKAQGHHYDYSKPFDVEWLCPRHHSEHHKQLRREQERR